MTEARIEAKRRVEKDDFDDGIVASRSDTSI